MVRSDNRLGQYLMLAPLGVSAVLIVLLSLALIFALSFQRVDPIRLFTEFTWAAYAESVSRPVFWLVLARSLLISAAVTAVTLLLSYPVAYFIAFKAGPGSLKIVSKRFGFLHLVTESAVSQVG